MFIINPKNIKDLKVYLASPEVTDYLLRVYGMAPLCYMATDDGQVKAGFRMTDELMDILKRIKKVGLGKE